MYRVVLLLLMGLGAESVLRPWLCHTGKLWTMEFTNRSVWCLPEGRVFGDGSIGVAVAKVHFNESEIRGTKHPMCYQKLRVTTKYRSLFIRVLDICEKCGPDDIAVSPYCYKELAGDRPEPLEVEWEHLPEKIH